MATIQLRRKTTSENGPLVGSSGSIKQGEPLIDLNGGNLYIAKKDKVASSSNQLSVADYFEFVNKDNLTSVLNDKIDELDLGTASKYDVGDNGGNVVLLDSDGTIPSKFIPQIAITNTFVCNSQSEMTALKTADVGDICIRNDVSKTYILKQTPYSTTSNWQELKTPTDKVTSVNGKTGAVNITLSELGGISTGVFNSRTTDKKVHLSATERTKLENIYASEIEDARSATWLSSASEFDSKTIEDGLYFRFYLTDAYEMPIKKFNIGINKDKVLTPTFLIDGGTY